MGKIEVSEYPSLIEIDKRDPWSACAREGLKDFLVNSDGNVILES